MRILVIQESRVVAVLELDDGIFYWVVSLAANRRSQLCLTGHNGDKEPGDRLSRAQSSRRAAPQPLYALQRGQQQIA